MLTELITEDTVSFFELEGTDAEFEIKFLDKKTLENIRAKNSKKVFDKKIKQNEDVLNFEKFGMDLVLEAVQGWRNLKLKDLVKFNYQLPPSVIRSEEEMNKEVPFSVKDLKDIARKAQDFPLYVLDICQDFQQFADKERENWGKKSESSQKASTTNPS